MARKPEVRASAQSESGPGREEQDPVAERKIIEGPVMDSEACRCRDDLRSRELHDFPVQHRRAGEGRPCVMRGTSRFAVVAEEVTERMAKCVACRVSSGSATIWRATTRVQRTLTWTPTIM